MNALRDQLLADVDSIVRNTDEFAVEVTYTPDGAAAISGVPVLPHVEQREVDDVVIEETKRFRVSTTDILDFEAGGDSLNPSLSGDGTVLAWDSLWDSFVQNDQNAALDVFVRLPNQCFGAEVYCTAKVSSNLCVPTIAASGVPSLSAPSGFTVATTSLEASVVGLDIYGTTGSASIPFQGGLICIGSPVLRLPGKPTGGAATCSGSISYTLDEVLAQPGNGVVAGGTLNLQTWTRDLGDAFGSSLSDAVEVTICP